MSVKVSRFMSLLSPFRTGPFCRPVSPAGLAGRHSKAYLGHTSQEHRWQTQLKHCITTRIASVQSTCPRRVCLQFRSRACQNKERQLCVIVRTHSPETSMLNNPLTTWTIAFVILDRANSSLTRLQSTHWKAVGNTTYYLLRTY